MNFISETGGPLCTNDAVHETTAATRIAQKRDDVEEVDAAQWQEGIEELATTDDDDAVAAVAQTNTPPIRNNNNAPPPPLSKFAILFICFFFSMFIGMIISGVFGYYH